MEFSPDSFYHIYNRGNDKQPIFLEERNYDYFLQKIKQYVLPQANLMAWCLMPNHFHMLVQATSTSNQIVKQVPIPINGLTESLRLMLSSYTRAIQKQEGITGSLFQQKTKAKCANDYLTSAFHYIHQNPYRAGLVKKMEEYPWSSIKEYTGHATENICNHQATWEFVGVSKERFLADSYGVIPDDVVRMME
jgi:REP element-mobilizing transposase RayT